MRNLSYLCDVTNKSAYKQFILNNANSIWLNNRNSANQFGLHWAGPFDTSDAVRQTSAMDALIAALSGFYPNEDWTHGAYYGSVGTYFADVDGDGRADAIVVNADKITVRRSTGAAFGTYESWTSDPFFGSRGTYFADVDGDGKVDAIVVSDTMVLVRRSTGSGFGRV